MGGDDVIVFDARRRRRWEAYAIAGEYARDGYMRFVFEHDGDWYVSRTEPPYKLVRVVEAVIPSGYRYQRCIALDA